MIETEGPLRALDPSSAGVIRPPVPLHRKSKVRPGYPSDPTRFAGAGERATAGPGLSHSRRAGSNRPIPSGVADGGRLEPALKEVHATVPGFGVPNPGHPSVPWRPSKEE